MSENTKFIKRVGLVIITGLATSLQGLILLPILAKNLGTAGYGVWAQILATVSLVLPFIMLGLPSAMLRFLSAEKEKKDVAKGIFTVLFVILFISIIFALVLFLLSDSFATFLLKDPSASFFIKIAAVLLILEAFNQASLETFRIFGQIRRYSALTISQAILEIVFISFLILNHNPLG